MATSLTFPAGGNFNPTVGSEITMVDDVVGTGLAGAGILIGYFQFAADVAGLALTGGPQYIFRVYRRMVAGGTYRLWICTPFTSADGEPSVDFPPFVSRYGFKITCQQANGSATAFDWWLAKLDPA